MNALNAWIDNDLHFVLALVIGVVLSAAIGLLASKRDARRKEGRREG